MPLTLPSPSLTRRTSLLRRTAAERPSGFADGLIEHQTLFGRLAPLAGAVQDTAERLAACLSTGGKLLLCGNGPSAAQAQQIAAALAGRLSKERRPLAALALSADPSTLTGIAVHHGFDEIFARQARALGRPGDSLLVLTAPPAPANLLRAVEVARDAGLLTVALLGAGNEALAAACHVALVVPGSNPVRVLEAQQFIGHSLCGLIETTLGLG
jgi:D-sedoheptulose 7-phosphate isomerase